MLSEVPSSDLPERVRDLREARGLSIAAAAKVADISARRWGQIEGGEVANPRRLTLAKMERALFPPEGVEARFGRLEEGLGLLVQRMDQIEERLDDR